MRLRVTFAFGRVGSDDYLYSTGVVSHEVSSAVDLFFRFGKLRRLQDLTSIEVGDRGRVGRRKGVASHHSVAVLDERFAALIRRLEEHVLRDKLVVGWTRNYEKAERFSAADLAETERLEEFAERIWRRIEALNLDPARWDRSLTTV